MVLNYSPDGSNVCRVQEAGVCVGDWVGVGLMTIFISPYQIDFRSSAQINKRRRWSEGIAREVDVIWYFDQMTSRHVWSRSDRQRETSAVSNIGLGVESTLQPGDYYRVQRQEAQLPQRNSASATHVFLGCKAKLIVRFTARTVRFTARLTAIRSWRQRSTVSSSWSTESTSSIIQNKMFNYREKIVHSTLYQ